MFLIFINAGDAHLLVLIMDKLYVNKNTVHSASVEQRSLFHLDSPHFLKNKDESMKI